MNKKFKKYSLKEKRDYYSGIIDNSAYLISKGKTIDGDRMDYAVGFYMGSKDEKKFTLDSKFNKNIQLGLLAGRKALLLDKVQNKFKK